MFCFSILLHLSVEYRSNLVAVFMQSDLDRKYLLIYTHFNTLKKKLKENIVEKGEIAQNEKFHLFQ